jgi:hypothetical protein
MNNITKKVDVAEIESSIQMLNQYINDASIKPVILVLESLINDPDNESLIVQLADTLKTIGVMQGAVLTYAPYISVLVSHGLFEDD